LIQTLAIFYWQYFIGKYWQYIENFMMRLVRGYWKLLQYIANIANIFIGNILLQGYELI
jgi:hypothetical protein